MNNSNHDAVRANGTALVISFIALALLLWFSVKWLGYPGVRLVGMLSIAAMSLAFAASLIVLWARRLKR